MSETKFCIKCFSGSLHEGTPEGKMETVAGASTYVAPAPKEATKKTIIFLTDVFGLNLPNPKLIADEYSRQGFNAYVPDILHGDPIPEDAFNNVKSIDELLAIVGVWIPTHGKETVTSIVDPMLEKLKTEGHSIGLVGFCFGGREVFHYAATDKVAAVSAMHPSLINLPDDAEVVKMPIAMYVSKHDELFSEEAAKTAESIFKKKGVPNECKIYDGEGVDHGFGTRADLSKPAAKAAKEDAHAASISWFRKYL